MPSEELQFYFKASDAVILPYPSHSSILNSGTFFSALTFGRPVIAPRMGCLTKYLTEDLSISYDPLDPSGLENALKEAPRLNNAASRTAAAQKAREWNPSDMSLALLKALHNL